MNEDTHQPSSDEPIHHRSIGDGGTPSIVERLGLYAWLLAMTGFLIWLIGFGVNV